MKYGFFSKSLFAAAAAVATALAMGSPLAQATPMETDAYSAASLAYQSSINTTGDLIYTSSSTLASQSATGTSTGKNAPGTNDGTAALSLDGAATYFNSNSGGSVTYNFKGSSTGYSITKVISYAGWQSNNTYFSNQVYNLKVKTVSDPTFVTVASVSFTPDANGADSSLVTLTPGTGLTTIATGVTAVQFVFGSLPAHSDGVVYQELEVYGSPTGAAAPEPASLAMFGFGAAGLLLVRRRRAAI